MPLSHLTEGDRTYTLQEYLDASIRGETELPGPLVASMLKNAAAYTNRNTVSGSQLGKECDLQGLMETHLDYSKEPKDLFWSAFRGALVHGMLEGGKYNPELKDYLFEERYFAIIQPDDSIVPLHLEPYMKEGNIDWEAFGVTCDELKAQGCVVLSGQIDCYNKNTATLIDWKTAKSVGQWTDVKTSWRHQLTLYRLLLELHGVPVKGIKVCVMDSVQPIMLTAEMVDLAAWSKGFLVPRARELSVQKDLSKDELLAFLDGEDVPGMPAPVPSFLCDGGKSGKGKVYCSFKDRCPAWREA